MSFLRNTITEVEKVLQALKHAETQVSQTADTKAASREVLPADLGDNVIVLTRHSNWRAEETREDHSTPRKRLACLEQSCGRFFASVQYVSWHSHGATMTTGTHEHDDADWAKLDGMREPDCNLLLTGIDGLMTDIEELRARMKSWDRHNVVVVTLRSWFWARTVEDFLTDPLLQAYWTGEMAKRELQGVSNRLSTSLFRNTFVGGEFVSTLPSDLTERSLVCEDCGGEDKKTHYRAAYGHRRLCITCINHRDSLTTTVQSDEASAPGATDEDLQRTASFFRDPAEISDSPKVYRRKIRERVKRKVEELKERGEIGGTGDEEMGGTGED